MPDTPNASRVEEAREWFWKMAEPRIARTQQECDMQLQHFAAAVRSDVLVQVKERCIPSRDELATLIEIQADQPEDVADRVIAYFSTALADLAEGKP